MNKIEMTIMRNVQFIYVINEIVFLDKVELVVKCNLRSKIVKAFVSDSKSKIE